MQIIGFSFEKISGERKAPAKGKLEVKSNIDLKDVTETKLSALGKDGVNFSFKFSINYEPKVAEIVMEGHIIAIFEKNKNKEIVKKWKAKKLADDVRIPIYNYILSKCNLKALQIEEEFALPPHIPMPKISATDNNRAYVR